MPCNSDYLEPSRRERELQRAAKLIIYVSSRLNRKVESWVIKEAKDCYASDDRSVPLLCELLGRLTEKQKNMIVYDARNKQSRDLADWWEEHQEADRLRLKKEEEDKEILRLQKSGLQKLTTSERRALGLRTDYF
jgi:hypothetical protein